MPKLISKAKTFVEKGITWHFHILTPECHLNKKKKFSLVLEGDSGKEIYIEYSEEMPRKMGEQLLQLLHGKDMATVTPANAKSLSEASQEIIKQARKLTKVKKFWHHHVLFPDCVFNKHPGKWLLMFEINGEKQILESVCDGKPVAELKEIEPLFYTQKK